MNVWGSLRAPNRCTLGAVLMTAVLAGFVAIAPAAGAATTGTTTVSAATTTSEPAIVNGVRLNAVEARLLARINDARKLRRLPLRRVAPGYTDVARRWSARLATRNRLGHNPDAKAQLEASGANGWRVLGENVGYGADADSLFMAYWNSPPHRANMLNPAYRYIGIGWATMANGAGFNTQNFVSCYSPAYGPTRVAVRGA